jgi:hypothetical protein
MRFTARLPKSVSGSPLARGAAFFCYLLPTSSS